ncbi:hypothetical protein BLA29_015126, partial [Euroglyphus maynei]
MFGSLEVQISEWYREMSNVKFSSSSSISEIVLCLDRLVFRAIELGISSDQLKFPFMRAIKSVISSHKRLETLVWPVI